MAYLAFPDGIAKLRMHELACDVVIDRGRGIRGRGDELIVYDGSFKIGGAIEFALGVSISDNCMARRYRCCGYQSIHEALRGWPSSITSVVTGLLW